MKNWFLYDLLQKVNSHLSKQMQQRFFPGKNILLKDSANISGPLVARLTVNST